MVKREFGSFLYLKLMNLLDIINADFSQSFGFYYNVFPAHLLQILQCI